MYSPAFSLPVLNEWLAPVMYINFVLDAILFFKNVESEIFSASFVPIMIILGRNF